MLTSVYFIKAITDLHAGSGDADFGIVDKLVQRDAATTLPTIYASSLKGALREYFDNLPEKGGIDIISVFGSESTAGQGNLRRGNYEFLCADIIAVPIPGNASPYYTLVKDDGHIQKLNEKYKLLSLDITSHNNGAVNSPDSFNTACQELPVIARNNLEDGQSKNLWYEEVVPHQSVFITAIRYPEDAKTNFFKEFNDNLHEKVIQIGANATVGYGLCLFQKL